MLRENGWRLRDSRQTSSSPLVHRNYVQSSRGEFSCMKHGYALLNTAWTSERTLNYLASGRPAIVQWTGESRFLPDREGIWRFRSPDEAVAGLRAVEESYDFHCVAARQLAEEYFDAQKVLRPLLEYIVT